MNFDAPSQAQGPSIYVAVPNPQMITTAPATFSGGVVLGFATFFPAISFATVPNVYGTANFGNHLSDALTIAIDPAFTTTEVSEPPLSGGRRRPLANSSCPAASTSAADSSSAG